jgi:hypothetical protein
MRSLAVLAAAATLLPFSGNAQTANDVGYCRQLAATYVYYIGRSEASTNHDIHRGTLDAQVAASQCQSRTADATRVLEQRLRDGKVTLPPRG